MAMITYPLNNVEYTAEDAELYNATRESGVYSAADFDFSVTGADTSVTVGDGMAWIKNSMFSGKVVAHKGEETFDFGVSDPSYPRIDVLAITFDSLLNETSLVVKKGVPSISPAIPSISKTENKYELYLFSVLRKAGSSVITESDITDLRDNRLYCGYMQDSIKPGYAPSLMEHNKGEDFRFWVGTLAEYEAYVANEQIPKNVFCIITDESNDQQILSRLKDLETAPITNTIYNGEKTNEKVFDTPQKRIVYDFVVATMPTELNNTRKITFSYYEYDPMRFRDVYYGYAGGTEYILEMLPLYNNKYNSKHRGFSISGKTDSGSLFVSASKIVGYYTK